MDNFHELIFEDTQQWNILSIFVHFDEKIVQKIEKL